ncbi:helix-turn-helix transcriptional regulator [Microbacteriaceae bacterium VKM Ac-2855]|nr:helix-turn-helix transcriptional regulator [Microbacteriaceae bacterium VKM Ac-2855]NQX10444.1 helix-turn-helix transcriptional regulator [Microbacteriaceae bacterium VKM Ac-2855]
MRRRIEYGWRLRELMAARGMNTISDLLPHLGDRGIELSASQIYRLVGSKPERMNLTLLGALLDTLDCSFEDLCPTTVEAESSRTPKKAVGDGTAPDGVVRPARARIRRPE